MHLLVLLALSPLSFAALLEEKAKEEKWHYLRPGPERFVTECRFTLQQRDGWTITSVTGQGANPLTVTTRYDRDDRLLGAEAWQTIKDRKTTVRVEVDGGKVKVQRDGQDAQEYEVPAGVIVTSAPDWTDTFLLCRRYDRTRGGKQEFAALWIHPVQPAQRLTFTIERQGKDSVEQGGKKVELDRYLIHIRNNSAYVAWADSQGQMIKLAPLPFKPNAANWLVLEGYEKSVDRLAPP
jgi:hypothetical protein